MFHTFASAEFKKGPRQLSYEDQFKDILEIFNNTTNTTIENRKKKRKQILDKYFTWTPADFWTTDTRIWNDLWTFFNLSWGGKPDILKKTRKFFEVYVWLYPELTEIQDLDFKDAMLVFIKQKELKEEKVAKLIGLSKRTVNIIIPIKKKYIKIPY